MREVPAKLYGFLREHFHASGYDVESAQRGLRLAQVDVGSFFQRVDWDELALFVDRVLEGCDDAAVITVGEGYVRAHPWVQLFARQVLTARILQYTAWSVSPPAFPHCDWLVERREDHVYFECHLPEPYRPCRPFFLGMVGEARALPTLLGQPLAHVDWEVSDRHGVYRIEHAEPLVALDRAFERGEGAAYRLYLEMRRMMEWIEAGGRPQKPRLADVVELQARYGLTPAEANVVKQIVGGQKVSAIARDLGISLHTVRSHLKAAFAKTDTSGQVELVRLVLLGELLAEHVSS